MSSKKVKPRNSNRFDSLRKRYKELQRKVDREKEKIHSRYGYSRQWYQWASVKERDRIEKMQDRADKAADKFMAYLETISPRNWSRGIAAHWIYEKLSFKDAIAPLDQPLSTMPVVGYGYGASEVKSLIYYNGK